jgi:cytochrome c peroxidase
MNNKQVFIVFFIGSFCFLGFKYVFNPTPYHFENIRYFPEMPTSKINPVTTEGVELGRFLFYDTILSENYTFSCGSCHKQEFAFSDSPNQFSKGINGELLDRNTMPLYNLAWYPSLFWDGRAASIENQVFFPVRAHKEMNLNWSIAEKRIQKSRFYKPLFKKAFGDSKIDSIRIALAIAQFERTLISSNSKFDQVLRGEKYLTDEEYEGYGLINDQTKGDCLHCHTTDGNGLGTILKFSNNGLDDYKTANDYLDKGLATNTKNPKDVGLFKIPSLRNIGITAPYMHDGRFKTLNEVLDFYSEGVNQSYNIDSKMEFAHQGGAKLTSDQKEKIISFLLTLTDSVFITNPEFSNPFSLNQKGE